MTEVRTATRGRWADPVLIGATALVAITIWFLRRPDQLLHPYVWVEEYQILNRAQEVGFLRAVFHPYQGYYLLPTSFTVASAAHWFSVVPRFDQVASSLWFLATVGLLLLPSSTIPLRWRALMALALVLVPADPEVFGIALYSFWWTGLWPLIVLLWRRDHWALRITAVAVGGASGLAGAVLVVPTVLSYALFGRRRRDLVASLVLAPILALQLLAYLDSARSRAPIDVGSIGIQLLRNLAYFAVLWVPKVDTALLGGLGFALAVGLTVATWHVFRRADEDGRRILAVVGSGFVLLSIVSSIPAPLIAHPVLAGPRYYFLPFLLLAWLLLVLLSMRPPIAVRVLAAILLVLGLVSLPEGFVRRADAVDWRGELARCETTPTPFFVPVHYTGRRAEMWVDGLSLTADTCRRLGHR